MSGGVEVDYDSAGFTAGLKAAIEALHLRTEDDVRRVALQVQNSARILCPVDTGRLRSSIKSAEGRDAEGFYVEVGTNVKYARFVEFGTSRAHAQPYLRPAFAEAAHYGPR